MTSMCFLGIASTEFTAEVDYLDYLATLRIGLVETEDGESVSVCIDCPLDADKRSACEKAIASRGMTFAREGGRRSRRFCPGRLF